MQHHGACVCESPKIAVNGRPDSLQAMSRSRSGGPPAQPLRSADGPGLLADPRDEDDDDSMLPPSHRPAPEPLPENERPFGRYTLLRRLAYGGMGEVFLARQGGAGSLAPVSRSEEHTSELQ